MDLEAKIRELIGSVLGFCEIENIASTEDLSAIGLDSLNCMEIIVALEDELNIEIPEDKLGIHFMHSIYDICNLVSEILDNDICLQRSTNVQQ